MILLPRDKSSKEDAEIQISLGVVEGIREVAYPAKSVGIYIYNIVPDK
jgi:hypothetical protein